MAKNLIIVGGRLQGNSRQLAEKIKSTTNDADLVVLANKKIEYCDGCLTCDESGQCHIQDDMTELLEKVKTAQTIIFVTPTRWNLLSGDIKVFLDRLNPFAVPDVMVGKNAIIVAIGQTSFTESDSINFAIESINLFCKSAQINVLATFGIGDCLNANDILKKESEVVTIVNEISKLGE